LLNVLGALLHYNVAQFSLRVHCNNIIYWIMYSCRHIPKCVLGRWLTSVMWFPKTSVQT